MDIHENARTTPHSRAEIVRRVIEEGESRSRVAQAFGVCCKTVSKWVNASLLRAPDGLRERSSRPHRLHRPTPGATVERILKLRRQRLPGHEDRPPMQGLASHSQSDPPRRQAQPGEGSRSA
jgi:transposase-like protein